MSNLTDQEYLEYQEKLKSKVYNALCDICSDVFDSNVDAKDQEKLLDSAYEWFTVHFFDE